MQANRRRDTKPELALRPALHRAGFRYRAGYRIDLPGRQVRPKTLFTRKRNAVIVNGCFQHCCPGHGSKPSANQEYRSPKLAPNVERSARNTAFLREAGWTVLRIWDHMPVEAVSQLIAAAVEAEREAASDDVAPARRPSLVIERIMVQVAATKRTTLYRMLEGATLDTALTESRRESDDHFTVTDVTVQQRPARLVFGAITTRPKWINDVKLLTGHSLPLSNSSPGAAFLIQDKADVIWALTWGTGFHFLDPEQINFGFGSGIVARSALPSEVKSLTKTILDHRARVDRSSMPNGSSIRDLGVDGYGEVVSRIESKAVIEDLAVGDRVIQLRAADSLNLPLAKEPGRLIEDLAVLDTLSQRPVRAGLESLEQLIALKPRDSRVPALDEKLVDALLSDEPQRLGVSWPHERLDVFGPVMSVKITGLGDHKRRVFDQAPDVSDITGWLSDVPREEVLERIKSVKIELHSETGPQRSTLVSAPVPLRRWLAFEVEDDNQRFCLHDGSWYRMDDQYLSRIDARVREILAEPPSLQLPPWGDTNEDEYNRQVAEVLSGYCLDRKLITTPLHSQGGIEPCDVFVAPGVLIHVKRGRRSSDLSHLLAQGLVSTDALARDENARAAWKKRIAEESGGTVKDAELNEVILSIGMDRPVTSDTLFTFTKVNLVKQFDALRYLDVKVHVTTALPPSPGD